jgi:hypothetical protein
MHRALLVCNSVFPDDPAGLPELNGPRTDGLILWRTLTDPTVGIYDMTNTVVLFERKSQEILAAIEDFFGSASPRDQLTFYYSGHGARSGGKLYLCGRDANSKKLISTGASADAIKDVIDSSKAQSTIVILDCCHSGAFKGTDQLVNDFKGSGRYVIAASRASELAEDAKELGMPSPFTGALVEALQGQAQDANSDGLLDLDEIYRSMHSTLQSRNLPEPRKHFDGAGNIVVGRTADSQESSTTAAADLVKLGVDDFRPTPTPISSVHEGATRDPLGTPMWYRRRSPGSYSLGDLKSSAVYGIAALASMILSGVLFDASGNYFRQGDRPSEAIGILCVGIFVASFTLLVISFIEFVLLNSRLGPRFTRRSAIALLDQEPARTVRRARDIVAILLGSAGLFTISGAFQSYDLRWVSLVAVITAVGTSSIINAARGGDTLYLGGATLLVIYPFLPLNAGDINGTEVLHLIIGILMVTGWIFQIERTWSALLGLFGVLVLLIVLAGGNIAGATFGAIGSGVALLAVAVGCGAQLQDGFLYSRSLVLHRHTRPADEAPEVPLGHHPATR